MNLKQYRGKKKSSSHSEYNSSDQENQNKINVQNKKGNTKMSLSAKEKFQQQTNQNSLNAESKQFNLADFRRSIKASISQNSSDEDEEAQKLKNEIPEKDLKQIPEKAQQEIPEEILQLKIDLQLNDDEVQVLVDDYFKQQNGNIQQKNEECRKQDKRKIQKLIGSSSDEESISEDELNINSNLNGRIQKSKNAGGLSFQNRAQIENLKSKIKIEEQKNNFQNKKNDNKDQNEQKSSKNNNEQKIRKSMNLDGKIINQLSKEKQKQICAICIEEIDEIKKVRINGCQHQFCYDCIFEWGTNAENLCPLCKQKFNIIFYKNVMGEESETRIEDKSQGLNVSCDFCSGRILEQDHNISFCNVCFQSRIHERCLPNYRRLNGYLFICQNCRDSESSESDSEGPCDHHILEQMTRMIVNVGLNHNQRGQGPVGLTIRERNLRAANLITNFSVQDYPNKVASFLQEAQRNQQAGSVLMFSSSVVVREILPNQNLNASLINSLNLQFPIQRSVPQRNQPEQRQQPPRQLNNSFVQNNNSAQQQINPFIQNNTAVQQQNNPFIRNSAVAQQQNQISKKVENEQENDQDQQRQNEAVQNDQIQEMSDDQNQNPQIGRGRQQRRGRGRATVRGRGRGRGSSNN